MIPIHPRTGSGADGRNGRGVDQQKRRKNDCRNPLKQMWAKDRFLDGLIKEIATMGSVTRKTLHA
jgi:hypothetical protein